MFMSLEDIGEVFIIKLDALFIAELLSEFEVVEFVSLAFIHLQSDYSKFELMLFALELKIVAALDFKTDLVEPKGKILMELVEEMAL